MMPRPLSVEARQKAIDAATSLLAEAGIDGFTVDEVARRSGVAKSTLYRHWSTGNELMVSALGCQIEQVTVPDTGSLYRDLVELFDTLRMLVDTRGTRRLMLDMFAAAARDAELEQVKHTMMAERTKPIDVLLTRAIERGEIPPVDLEQAGIFIHGPFIARTLLYSDHPSREEVEILVAQIFRGLGGELPDG